MNNFVANQLFLTIGAHIYGQPATWQKSQQALSNFLLQNIGIAATDFRIIEGSGLSRQTVITPNAMHAVLKAFTPYRTLLPKENRSFIKSGTLKGVYCYAGFNVLGSNTYPFVIMLNQARNARDLILKKITKNEQE